MCGIVGKVSIVGGADRSLLESMCNAVVHRGPDSRGTWLEDGTALGVQRLAIIDLETGDQPVFNEDRRLVVILNGEIYNYRELRESLIALGHVFTTASDTETLVHLYEEYGEDCVDHLRGMFAFAIWDRARERLFLARDRVGKKPLFMRATERTIWFASEIRALMQDPEVPRDIDRAALDAYLRHGYVPGPQSAFRGIKKLPPGHVYSWERGHGRLRKYWSLSYAKAVEETEDADICDHLRHLLLEATRLRMRSDVPTGALLSGGIDSSAVVAAMAQQSSSRIRTFSIGFDDERFDETAHARAVAQRYETEHHNLVVKSNAVEMLPRIVWHHGEPFADHSAVPTFALAELTRQHVTVALNGDGGDECFAGYPRYQANLIAERLRAVPAPIRSVAMKGITALGSGSRQGSSRHRIWRLLQAIDTPAPRRYSEWLSPFSAGEVEALYQPEYRAAVAEEGPEDKAMRLFRDSDAVSTLDRMLDTDVQTYLPDDLLVKMDIASMAHSLEVRSPLLDHVFMEFAAALPAGMKLRGRTPKAVFKDAVRQWLPDRIVGRPKMGFNVPVTAWFRGTLRDLPAEVLLDSRAMARGMFRPDAVQQLINDHQSGRSDNGRKLWTLVVLELWARTFIDAESPQVRSLIAT